MLWIEHRHYSKWNKCKISGDHLNNDPNYVLMHMYNIYCDCIKFWSWLCKGGRHFRLQAYMLHGMQCLKWSKSPKALISQQLIIYYRS